MSLAWLGEFTVAVDLGVFVQLEIQMSKILFGIVSALAASAAVAAPDLTVPTPGTLSLVGLAAAVGIAVALRKKK
jgi:hypothetical protein